MSACTFPTNQAAPAPSVTPLDQHAPTISPLPTSNQEETCNLAAIHLETWKQTLPYPEIILVPQIYLGETSLIVWYPDPALSQTNSEEIDTQASQSAIAVANQLSIEDACLFAFDSVYITVVDPGYQLRFSGSLRTADLPQTLTGNLANQNAETGGGQVLPTENEDSGAGQSCQWTQISGTLNELVAENTTSSAFALGRDAGGTNITAYLQFSTAPTDEALSEIIETLYGGLGCLQSTVNGISIAITLPDAQLVLTGYQPLNPAGSYDPATFTFTRFDAQ